MKATRKTKKQLIEELAALQERISELEILTRDFQASQKDFGEKIGRYFPQAEHLNEAVYVIFDRKYEFINEKFAELFGVTSEEVCSPGFDPMTLVAPESRSFVHEKFREGYHGDFMAQQYEFTAITKHDIRIVCETYVLLIPYKWGVAFHGMLRDISVRKRIDVELQRHHSDLQIVLDSIPTSIFYTDKSHRFSFANKAFCKSLGFPLEQIIGKTLAEMFPNLPVEQLSHFFEVNDQVMSSGQSKRGFIEIFPSIRGRRWIQNDRMPYRDEEGNIIGVICLAIDISDFRETEDKLFYLSFHDVLTGYYNRTYFEDELTRIERGRQFPISVVSARVDNLQAVNDRKGMAAGNELLLRTANVLKIFRTEDIIARVAGDRFAVLLPLSDQSIAEKLIVRLNKALEVQNKEITGNPLHLSFGVATGDKGSSLFDVLKQAESNVS